MKRFAAVSAVALLLISGCGSNTEELEPKTPTPSTSATARTSASSEVVQSASEEQVCQELLGTSSDGPLYETVFLVTDPAEKTDAAATVATARRLNEEIQVLADAAPKLMGPLVRNLSGPLEDIIGLTDQTRTTSEMDVEVWKKYTTNLLNLCAPYETSTGNEPAPAAPTTSKADEVSASFPGYPLLVNVSSLDYRIANWFDGKLVDGQVVALAPGLYAPYNPNVSDLGTYYESGGVAGDSAIKKAVLPNAGGATWPGVLPGPEEPQ